MDNYIVKIRHSELIALNARVESLESENKSLKAKLAALSAKKKKNETKKEEKKNDK